MQKYILGAEPADGCALICPLDDTVKSGEWRKYNAGIVYLVEEVDAHMRGRADYPCSIYSNPFPEGTVEFRRWVGGWADGVIAEDVQFIVKCRNYAYEHGDPVDRIAELERQLALANDVAAKGESARLTVAGMEAHIDEMEASHHAAAVALKDELIQAQQAIQRMTVEAMAMDKELRDGGARIAAKDRIIESLRIDLRKWEAEARRLGCTWPIAESSG